LTAQANDSQEEEEGIVLLFEVFHILALLL
jgi:hypothetical protein